MRITGKPKYPVFPDPEVKARRFFVESFLNTKVPIAKKIKAVKEQITKNNIGNDKLATLIFAVYTPEKITTGTTI
jgi:hypothetical protein